MRLIIWFFYINKCGKSNFSVYVNGHDYNNIGHANSNPQNGT